MARVGYLLVGVILALVAVMHLFITFEHWRQVGPNQESVLKPAGLSLVSGALSIWFFNLARRTPSGATR